MPDEITPNILLKGANKMRAYCAQGRFRGPFWCSALLRRYIFCGFIINGLQNI
jgi:hypothetical protein